MNKTQIQQRRYGPNHELLWTINVYPPIPIRCYDWCCYEDGMEEYSHLYGWGYTKQGAIDDWIEHLKDK